MNRARERCNNVCGERIACSGGGCGMDDSFAFHFQLPLVTASDCRRLASLVVGPVASLAAPKRGGRFRSGRRVSPARAMSSVACNWTRARRRLVVFATHVEWENDGFPGLAASLTCFFAPSACLFARFEPIQPQTTPSVQVRDRDPPGIQNASKARKILWWSIIFGASPAAFRRFVWR